MSLSAIGNDLVGSAAEIARQITMRWSAMAENEPWLERFTRIRQDHLPAMIRALAEAALVAPESTGAAARLIEESRRHGASRRRDGHDDSIIPAEYVLVRRALRHVLMKEREIPAGMMLPTLSLLELGIGLAEIASLHGYHAEAVESDDGRDPEAEEQEALRNARMLEEWSGLIHEVMDPDERKAG